VLCLVCFAFLSSPLFISYDMSVWEQCCSKPLRGSGKGQALIALSLHGHVQAAGQCMRGKSGIVTSFLCQTSFHVLDPVWGALLPAMPCRTAHVRCHRTFCFSI
jgi:hypothetical protein